MGRFLISSPRLHVVIFITLGNQVYHYILKHILSTLIWYRCNPLLPIPEVIDDSIVKEEWIPSRQIPDQPLCQSHGHVDISGRESVCTAADTRHYVTVKELLMQISHDTIFQGYVQNPCRKYLLEKARLHSKTLWHCQGGVNADPTPDDTVNVVLMQIPHQMTLSRGCWCRSPTRWHCQGGVDVISKTAEPDMP